LRLGQVALLQGILYCRQCGATMTAQAAQEGAPQSRCYVCARCNLARTQLHGLLGTITRPAFDDWQPRAAAKGWRRPEAAIW
jgi:Recombinase zinc beta ribbon domain